MIAFKHITKESIMINPRKRLRDPEPLQFDLISQLRHFHVPSPPILGPAEEMALRNPVIGVPSSPQIAHFFQSSPKSSITDDDLAAIDLVMASTPAPQTEPVQMPNAYNTFSSFLQSNTDQFSTATISTISDSSFESLSLPVPVQQPLPVPAPVRPRKRSKAARVFTDVDVSERPHECNTCQVRFKVRGDLRRHIKTVHEGKRQYACPKCPKTFAHSGHLNRHFSSAHLGIRKHKCTTCGDAFFQASHLKSHIKHVHYRNKPWACKHCDLRFATESTLGNHIRVEHSDQIFPCPEPDCNHEFGLAADLGRHCLLTHGHSQ